MKTCRECGINEDGSVEFKPSAKICKPCHAKYMTAYRKKNQVKITQKIQNWKDTNREAYKESCRKHHATPEGKAKHVARVVKTWRSWLSHLLSRIKHGSKNPGPHDPKSGPKRDFDLNIDYVGQLCEKQKGKCAVSGVPMTREFNSLFAASIDRIDSSQGHVKGNVQIVCQGINWMKRHLPQEQVFAFLDAHYDHRVERVSNLVADYERSKQIEESEVFPHVADDIVM